MTEDKRFEKVLEVFKLDTSQREQIEYIDIDKIDGNEIVSVHWHGSMAGFVWNQKRDDSEYQYDFGALFRSYDKYEVIGNIYDNPELLE